VALAWTTPAVGSVLRRAMLYLLIVELIGAGGFLALQVAGTVGKTGRILGWAGGSGIRHAQQLDEALRGFYRHQWRRFLASVGLYFVGWLLGAVQGVQRLRRTRDAAGRVGDLSRPGAEFSCGTC